MGEKKKKIVQHSEISHHINADPPAQAAAQEPPRASSQAEVQTLQLLLPVDRQPQGPDWGYTRQDLGLVHQAWAESLAHRRPGSSGAWGGSRLAEEEIGLGVGRSQEVPCSAC